MFIHKENNLFLGINCQPILARGVLLLPLAQLERSYCFLAYNSKGFWTQAGDQEKGSKNSSWRMEKRWFLLKAISSAPTLSSPHRHHAEGTPRPRASNRTPMYATLTFTPTIQQKKETANLLTLPLSHPSWRLNKIIPISQMTGNYVFLEGCKYNNMKFKSFSHAASLNSWIPY